MPTTDEEVVNLQQSVEKKREQLIEQTRLADERVRAQSNDITAAQLKAEEARLDAALSAAKEAAKVSTVKAGAAGPLEIARQELRDEAERAKQREALVQAQKDNEQAAKQAAADSSSSTTENKGS